MKSRSLLRNLAALPSRRVQRTGLWLLVWLFSALLPIAYRHEGLSAPLVSKLAAAPLAFALANALEKRRPKWAEALFLTVTPAALALGMTSLDHDVSLATYSPLLLLTSALLLALYFAVTLTVMKDEEPSRKVEQKPLGELAEVHSDRRKQRLSTLLLAVLASAGIGGTTWSTWASPAHYRERWGHAAAQGATLSALAAGFIACAAILIVAPKLRGEKLDSGQVRAAPRRAGWLVLVAVSGALVYALLAMR